jgi:hypothetical protein
MGAQVASHIDEGADGWRWTTCGLWEGVAFFAENRGLAQTCPTTSVCKTPLAPFALLVL